MTFDFCEDAYRSLLEDKDIIRILSLNPKSIIPFPLIYKRLGVIYHFSKKKSLVLLKSLERRGLIKIVRFHGIKINC
jgi:DNA-binding Lrp family transcriptional regulator